MKQKLILFTTLIVSIVVSCHAQKIKKVKGGERVYYECCVDKDKTPYGEGDVTFSYRFDKVGKIHFKDIKFTKEKAELTINLLIGKMVFNGILTVPHNAKYDQGMQLFFSKGTISKGEEVYEIDDTGFSVDFYNSFGEVKSLQLHTPYMQGRELGILKDSPDNIILNDMKLRLYSYIDVMNGIVNPVNIETENGEYYSIERVANTSSYRISGYQIGNDVITIDASGNISYKQKKMYIIDANTKYGLDGTLSKEYDKIIKSQPQKEGTVLMTGDYNSGTNIAYKNGQPIAFPDNYLAFNNAPYKEYTPEVKKMIFELIPNSSNITWERYNYADGNYNSQLSTIILSKLIYHGEDLLSAYKNTKNAQINAAKNKEKSEYDAMCRKYGKKYVDAALTDHRPIVGMPEQLLIEQFGLIVKSRSNGITIYKWAAFRVYITVKNGKVTAVSAY